ncbi:6344_t:CDS:2 [Paraglomus occultum]|uniref:6344_t:CDS:1 n=1 Tax=Paraglomus occultum TaxID=144539 RepID=A0A9N8WCR1_9GLOM|nr:6344_t:CDS:2 [Paraglomus occultum]
MVNTRNLIRIVIVISSFLADMRYVNARPLAISTNPIDVKLQVNFKQDQISTLPEVLGDPNYTTGPTTDLRPRRTEEEVPCVVCPLPPKGHGGNIPQDEAHVPRDRLEGPPPKGNGQVIPPQTHVPRDRLEGPPPKENGQVIPPQTHVPRDRFVSPPTCINGFCPSPPPPKGGVPVNDPPKRRKSKRDTTVKMNSRNRTVGLPKCLSNGLCPLINGPPKGGVPVIDPTPPQRRKSKRDTTVKMNSRDEQ